MEMEKQLTKNLPKKLPKIDHKWTKMLPNKSEILTGDALASTVSTI